MGLLSEHAIGHSSKHDQWSASAQSLSWDMYFFRLVTMYLLIFTCDSLNLKIQDYRCLTRVLGAASGSKTEPSWLYHMLIISFYLGEPATDLKHSTQLKPSVMLSD